MQTDGDTFRAQVLTSLEMIPSTSTALWGLYPCQKAATELLN